MASLNSLKDSLASASRSSLLIIATTRDYFSAMPHLCRNLFSEHVSTNLKPQSSISLYIKSMLKSKQLVNSCLNISLYPARLSSNSSSFARALSICSGKSSLLPTV